MPVEEAYRYIRSGVLKHYPSFCIRRMPLKGRWRLPRSAIRVERTLTTVSYYAFEGLIPVFTRRRLSIPVPS